MTNRLMAGVMEAFAAMTNRLHSWWDVNAFIVSTLSPPSILRVSVWCIVFFGGLLLWIGDLVSGAWIAVVVGFLGLAKDVLSVITRWVTSPRMSLKKDEGSLTLFSRMELSQDYVDAKYEIYQVSGHSDEYVVRSPRVDASLRTNDFKVEQHQELLKPINEGLRKISPVLEDALRCQYRRSWRADPPQQFVNEGKICVGSDLFAPPGPIKIYRGSYFHSFLTNDLVTSILESYGTRPQILYRGSERFPAFPQNDGVYKLKRIPESLMGNHVGISTVVHTSDDQIVLWRQSNRAQQSGDYIAPTGSGSCDWEDFGRASRTSSLKTLVSIAMEREFREESHPLESALRGIAIKTSILGYFRWVRRGGKPEFVGISKIEAPVSKLDANISEVDAPEHLQLVYPAGTVAQLQSSIAALLASERLSVPLWVNLTCLKEALNNETEQWTEFLTIPP